jgi:hypothetical protein
LSFKRKKTTLTLLTFFSIEDTRTTILDNGAVPKAIAMLQHIMTPIQDTLTDLQREFVKQGKSHLFRAQTLYKL